MTVVDEILLQQVAKACLAAGRVVAEVFSGFDHKDIALKGDNSPVTSADLRAHKILVDALSDLTNWPIISEEAAIPPHTERRSWQHYWLIDPLDGTQEFIDGGAEFTVNVALIEKGKPRMGVVYAPMLDLLYSGLHNFGAWKSHANRTHSISTRKLSPRVAAGLPIELVCSRRHGTAEIAPLVESLERALGLVVTKSVGSSLKFCLVAEGEADLYPRLAPTHEWDSAAAQSIVEAAGGAVVTKDFFALQYNRKESLLNDNFFVLGDIGYNWKALLSTS
ncbi:3'(2'), 5'-bisphosphate nucleotidase [Alteromonadaceae bacterium 2753L.S.0a.02]|nr:3'(2'), 5'-bisphosphate nucleotidase [Alteromonadaceae bacterium 2753L.S.0a.02]